MSFAPLPLGTIWNASTAPTIPGCTTKSSCETFCKSTSGCVGFNFGEGMGGCVAPQGSCYTLVAADLNQVSLSGFASYLISPSANSNTSWHNIAIFLVICIFLAWRLA